MPRTRCTQHAVPLPSERSEAHLPLCPLQVWLEFSPLSSFLCMATPSLHTVTQMILEVGGGANSSWKFFLSLDLHSLLSGDGGPPGYSGNEAPEVGMRSGSQRGQQGEAPQGRVLEGQGCVPP